jgi:transcriptional regulator with XRE-family HTH domain
MRRSTEKETEFAERRRGIAADYLRGMSQPKLAEKYGVSQPTVSRDLEYIRHEWLKSTLIDFNEAKARELAMIDDIQAEAWDAWARSKITKLKASTVDGPQGRTVSAIKEERDGNPQFLAIVQWAIEQRCKIFGLYEAAKISFNWRQAVEEQGLNAGDIFEKMVENFTKIIDPDTD